MRRVAPECACLRIISFGILCGSAATDVADSDGMGVLARCVCSDLIFRTPTMNGAVAVDYIVIADIGEATGEMPLADLGDSIILSLRRGRAMEDYLIDAPGVR